MVIVDSSVWIDLFSNRATAQTIWLRTAILGGTSVGLTSLILCEVLQGVRHDRQFGEFSRSLLQFTVFEAGSSALAVQAASNFRALRTQGITIRKTIDCLIATFCIEQGHILLHNDRDFDFFESHLGLQVLHPAPGALH